LLVKWRFGGTYLFNFQDREARKVTNQHEAILKQDFAWAADRALVSLLPKQDNADTKEAQTVNVTRMGFEPAVSVFELWKTVDVLDRAATAISENRLVDVKNVCLLWRYLGIPQEW
jgi:hypothetical protein